MSHAVKYRATEKVTTNANDTTYIIEILQDEFGGSVTEVLGDGDSGIFQLHYDKIDPREPFKNPAQKGRMEFYLLVEDASDQDILDELFSGDGTEYQMRLKVEGSVVWTGTVINDLMEYSEGQFPYAGKIVAKDLTRLSGITYSLNSGRETIITTIASLLDPLNLGLDIFTYTSWTEDNISVSDDFLNQIYNDVFALREYARTGDETDQPLKQDELLDKILRNYGLILRQDEGAWRIYQLTAFSDPTSVDEYRYNSSGVQQSSSTVDMTVDVDRVERFILPSSMNMINPAIKEAGVRFDHRTLVSGIKFEDWITLDDDPTSAFDDQFFASDGNQRIRLQADVEADIDQAEENGYIQFQIQAGSYHWNESTRTWQGTSFVNELELAVSGTGNTAGTFLWTRSLDLQTKNTPSDADGTLQITLFRGNSDTINAEETRWKGTRITILDPIVEEGTSTAIDYRLSQTGNFSKVNDHGSVWYGDGPVGYSRAALSSDGSGSTLTNDSWKIKGDAASVNFFRLLLRELMDNQRVATRNLDGVLWGQYSTKNLISYNTDYLFFMGGILTGKENIWNGRFLELNIQGE